VARPETRASLGGKSRGGLRPKRTGFHDGNIPSRTEVGRKQLRDTTKPNVVLNFHVD